MCMSEVYEIQIGTGETANSVLVDNFLSLNLKTNTAEILPYDQTSVISAAQLFDDERQASSVFRIYGSVDFISIVNGLKLNYNSLNDFWTRPRIGMELSGLTRNLLNTFDIYLCKQKGNLFEVSSGIYSGRTFTGSKNSQQYKAYSAVTVLESGNTGFSATNYQRAYEVLTNLSSCEIYKLGYAKNIFNDQIYGFNFNVDIDVSDQFDSFGKPIMSLYLFFNFKPRTVSYGTETIRKKFFDSGSTESINNTGLTSYVVYKAGDIVSGDLVFYDRSEFEEILLNEQEYYTRFPVSGGTYLEFKYNPFVEIKLRDFNNTIVLGNITGTSEIDQNIPNYAVSIDNTGNYVWEDILPYGYIDPVSGRGVSNPFMNMRHYIFNPVTLSLAANLNNTVTANNFANMTFGPESVLNAKPSNLNNLNAKC